MTKRVGIIMARRFDLKYYVQEGATSIFSHGLMSFAAICMIVACLLIMGSFSLVAVNLDNMLGTLEAENEFLAYVDHSYTEEQARALATDLMQIQNVAQVTFVTRAEAMEIFLAGQTKNSTLQSVPADVLRDRFRIHVHEIEDIQQTADMVKQVEGVDEISVMIEVAQGLIIVRNIASGIAIVLIVMLMVISFFIIANTIRLATFYRREEIAIMRMCGANNAFICWPFVFEGAILGLSGAITAYLLQWLVYNGIAGLISSAGELSLISILPFSMIAVKLALVFAGTGLVIGIFGSLLAIRRFLTV